MIDDSDGDDGNWITGYQRQQNYLSLDWLLKYGCGVGVSATNHLHTHTRGFAFGIRRISTRYVAKKSLGWERERKDGERASNFKTAALQIEK